MNSIILICVFWCNIHISSVVGINSELQSSNDLQEDCPTCSQFKMLEFSVLLLENQISQINKKLKDSERKLKELETCDCFKSCNVNGSVQPDGSTWKQDCNICYCHHGHVTCRPIQCPTPLCKYPQFNQSECCPTCKRSCYLNNKAFQHGEKLKIPGKNGRCGECICHDGKATCKQITSCPKLNCSKEQQYLRPDECCPICAGYDFCGEGHDCHHNAKCHNLNTEYVCKCNDGYFGNGKECEDINECLTTGTHYGHHCRMNTKCVNLPGSYKCECLPGFTRYDSFNCVIN